MTMVSSNRFRKAVELEMKVMKVRTKIEVKSDTEVGNTIKTQNWVRNERKKSFDTNYKLSEKYRIKSAGNHFYEIGLTFYPFAGEERHWLS